MEAPFDAEDAAGAMEARAEVSSAAEGTLEAVGTPMGAPTPTEDTIRAAVTPTEVPLAAEGVAGVVETLDAPDSRAGGAERAIETLGRSSLASEDAGRAEGHKGSPVEPSEISGMLERVCVGKKRVEVSGIRKICECASADATVRPSAAQGAVVV